MAKQLLGVYMLFKGRECVYVGSGDINARVASHYKDEKKDFDRVMVLYMPYKEMYLNIEAALIKALDPRYNSSHNLVGWTEPRSIAEFLEVSMFPTVELTSSSDKCYQIYSPDMKLIRTTRATTPLRALNNFYFSDVLGESALEKLNTEWELDDFIARDTDNGRYTVFVDTYKVEPDGNGSKINGVYVECPIGDIDMRVRDRNWKPKTIAYHKYLDVEPTLRERRKKSATIRKLIAKGLQVENTISRKKDFRY